MNKISKQDEKQKGKILQLINIIKRWKIMPNKGDKQRQRRAKMRIPDQIKETEKPTKRFTKI